MSLVIIVLVVIAFFIISLFYLFPWLFGAAYDFTWPKVVEQIIIESKIKRGEKAVDLGSGDGRIVIAFAKKGYEAHGYEINPILVWFSRRKIRKLGLENKAFIHYGNFWSVNLSKYDKIILFQFSNIMRKLGEKFKKELKKGSLVISYYWKIPNMKLEKVVKVEGLIGSKYNIQNKFLYLYRV